MEEIRLQKFLAECGIASRRKSEEYILNGQVKVNGNTITELGVKVDPDKDIILFNNEVVNRPKEKHIYILLNKPIGYVTTVKDQFERPTVIDLIKGVQARLVPVGRLDMYTSGALILTNDGDFVYKVTHPKFEIEKMYTVSVRGKVSLEELDRLRNGVQIDDYISQKAQVKVLKYDEERDLTRLQIVIHEGKNREVRKMCETIGKKVVALHRNKIGNLDVKELKIGEWKYIQKEDLKK